MYITSLIKACIHICGTAYVNSSIKSPPLSRRISGGKDRFNAHFSLSAMNRRRNAKKKKKKRVLFEDDRRPYVVELDEETDLDMMAILSDRTAPSHMEFVNTHVVPGSLLDLTESLDAPVGSDRQSEELISSATSSLKVKEIKVMRRVKVDSRAVARGGINPLINQAFQDAYARLCFPLRTKTPCEIVGLSHRITVLDDSTIEIFFIAMSHYREAVPLNLPYAGAHPVATEPSSLSLSSSMNQLSLALSSSAAARPALQPLIPLEAFAFQKLQVQKANICPPHTTGSMSFTKNVGENHSESCRDSEQHNDPLKSITGANQAVANVTLTSLNYIPGHKVLRYLGPLQLHFIKESWGMSGKGPLGTFFYIFQSEIDAAARAQVRADNCKLFIT